MDIVEIETLTMMTCDYKGLCNKYIMKDNSEAVRTVMETDVELK